MILNQVEIIGIYKMNILDIINEEVNNILLESYRGFSFKVLKSLKTIKEINEYAEKHLIELGSGSTRRVFALGSGKVLKVQIPSRWLQNKQEVSVYTNSTIPKKYLAKIYDFADNYFWIISEAVQVFIDNKQAYSKLTIDTQIIDDFIPKIEHTNNLSDAIKETINHRNLWFEDEIYVGTNKKIEVEDLNKFDMQLLKGIYDLTKLGVADIDRLDHWGITSNGNVVLVDYGYF